MKSKHFAVIFFIGMILRFLNIWRSPLWYDENFSLILAQLPFAKMMAATAGDVHPPLYYILTWLTAYGIPFTAETAWLIRLPSLVISCLSLMLFWRVMESLWVPVRVQVVAMVLMAILPMQIWYAQEARMYALLEMLVLLALHLALTRRWVEFTFTAIALLYTQNYAAFYLASIWLVVLMRDVKALNNVLAKLQAGLMPSANISRASVSLLIAFCFYLPWVNVIASQMGQISGRYWITDTSLGAALTAIFKNFWASAMPYQFAILAHFVTFAVLMIGVYVLIANNVSLRWELFTLAFAPLLMAWIVSVIWQPILLYRPLIGVSPFLYIIAAWPVLALAEISYNLSEKPQLRLDLRRTLYAACFIAPIIVAGILGYYKNIADMKGEGAISSMLEVLTYVRENWREGDVIYYTDDGPMLNIMPYAADLPQFHMPAGCGDQRMPVLGSLSDSTRQAIGTQIADLATVPHQRAWVFAPRSPLHPVCYEEQIAALTPGDPVLWVDRNEYIESGVWLVDASQANQTH